MQTLNSKQVQAVCRLMGLDDFGMNRREAAEIINGAGCDAFFIGVNETYGLKFYDDQKTALIAFWYTRIMYHFGVCPKAWGFGSVHIRWKSVWFFHMERVDVLSDIVDEDDDDDYTDWDDEIEQQNKQLQETTGFRNGDSHFGNYGVDNYGNLKCIDIANLVYYTEDGRDIFPKWA